MTPFKTTLAFGVPIQQHHVGGSATATRAGYELTNPRRDRAQLDLDDTLESITTTELLRASNPLSTQTRTTVLPRRARGSDGAPQQIVGERARFDMVRQLGEGAVGTVELARDNDIRRTVAVKKLKADVRTSGSFLRFADEVRIVGQLEHPSIVPVYDVGRDESGDVYLVMKHLEGETMEDIIDKLRAGEPSYVERFSPQFRARLFLSVLDAIRYAHSRGILHRDIKPANIMIGLYDEVTVMDWGIAKPIARHEAAAPTLDVAKSWLDSHDQRLLETQMGMLAGTPFYMSPEQAAGMNDALDERSDVYTLAVVFFEWLTLRHPLEGKSSLIEVLASIITQEHDQRSLVRSASDAGVPYEYMYLVARGLRRDRDARIGSAGAMYDELKAILEGKVRVECAVTFTKRATHEGLRWVDRHPARAMVGLAFAGLAMLVGVATVVTSLVRAVT